MGFNPFEPKWLCQLLKVTGAEMQESFVVHKEKCIFLHKTITMMPPFDAAHFFDSKIGNFQDSH